MRFRRLGSLAVTAALFGAQPAAAGVPPPNVPKWMNSTGTSPFFDDTAISPHIVTDGHRVFMAGRTVRTGEIGTAYLVIAMDAESGITLWRAVYSGPRPGGLDMPTSLALSPDGSRLYVTGMVDAGPFDEDVATVALDTETGSIIWASTYDGPVDGGFDLDFASSIVVSPDGELAYVSGGEARSGNTSDHLTIAYSTRDGSSVWVATYNGPGNYDDGISDSALSPDGARLFVTGLSEGATTGRDVTTIAYDARDGERLWMHSLSRPGWDHGKRITVAPDGSRVFVAGAVGEDIVTIAYAAETGATLWMARYNGPSNGLDSAGGIVLAPDATQVFIAGQTADESRTGSDALVIAYAAQDGAAAWTTLYEGLTPDASDIDMFADVVAARDGESVIATGPSQVRDPVVGFPDAQSGNATVAFDAATGSVRWVGRSDVVPAGLASGGSLALDPDGARVYSASTFLLNNVVYSARTLAYCTDGIGECLLPRPES